MEIASELGKARGRRRIAIARVLYGVAILPTLLLIGAIPIPPNGRELTTLVLLVAALIAIVALVVALRKWFRAMRWVAFVLGLYGLYWCVGAVRIVANAPPLDPALLGGILVSGSGMLLLVLAALLLVRVPPPQTA